MPDFAELAAALFPLRSDPVTVLHYADRPGADIVLRTPAAGGPAPLAILFHGGGWRNGSPSRDWPLALSLAVAGWATASVRYRLSGEAPAPAALEDAIRAVARCRETAGEHGIDIDRIVLIGVSAGGHLALMTGIAPTVLGGPAQPRVAAIVNFYGISDLGALLCGPDAQDFARQWLSGTTDQAALAEQLSPLSIARSGGDFPPVISCHGSDDTLVPIAQSVALHEALGRAGTRHQLVRLRGDHGRFPAADRLTAFSAIERFLRDLDLWPRAAPESQSSSVANK